MPQIFFIGERLDSGSGDEARVSDINGD